MDGEDAEDSNGDGECGIYARPVWAGQGRTMSGGDPRICTELRLSCCGDLPGPIPMTVPPQEVLSTPESWPIGPDCLRGGRCVGPGRGMREGDEGVLRGRDFTGEAVQDGGESREIVVPVSGNENARGVVLLLLLLEEQQQHRSIGVTVALFGELLLC